MKREEFQGAAVCAHASDPFWVLNQRLKDYRDRMAAVPPGDLTALREAFRTYGTGSLSPAIPRPDIRIEQAEDCPVPATWFIPPDSNLQRSTLYLHGGGFLAGDLEMYAPLVAELASSLQHNVLFVSYSLAPESVFPRPLEEALEAYAWLVEFSGRPGTAAPQPSVFGDSCGAALAISLAASRREQGLRPPFALVGLSPAFDFSGTIVPDYPVDDALLSADAVTTQCDVFRGEFDRIDPLISPAFQATEGLPPTLLQVGSGEYSRAAADHFARSAAASGAPVTVDYWPAMPHAWHLCLDILPGAKAALHAAAEFALRPESRSRPGHSPGGTVHSGTRIGLKRGTSDNEAERDAETD